MKEKGTKLIVEYARAWLIGKTHLSPKVTPTLGLKMSGFSYSELPK